MHHYGKTSHQMIQNNWQNPIRRQRGQGKQEVKVEEKGLAGTGAELAKTLTAAPLICAPHPATQPPTAAWDGLIIICKGPALDCDIQPYWEIKKNDTKT